MKNNKSTIIWIIAVVLVLGVLFAWPKLNNPNKSLKKVWAAANVECLNSHANAAKHIHPRLTIEIDGKNEILPAHIGEVQGCMAELHTHDATGVIHLETAEANKVFTLAQFFTVWNQPVEKDGYALKATANGKPVADLKNLILEDKQEIILEYTRN